MNATTNAEIEKKTVAGGLAAVAVLSAGAASAQVVDLFSCYARFSHFGGCRAVVHTEDFNGPIDFEVVGQATVVPLEGLIGSMLPDHYNVNVTLQAMGPAFPPRLTKLGEAVILTEDGGMPFGCELEVSSTSTFASANCLGYAPSRSFAMDIQGFD